MVSRSSGVVAALLLICLNTVMALAPAPATNVYDETVSVLRNTTAFDPAVVISPAPNSTLTGSSVTFQ
jgi:hypothetical protein